MDVHSLQQSIRGFLQEDIGRGDITSESIFSPLQTGQAELVAREPLFLVGAKSVAGEVFKVQNSDIRIADGLDDGTRVKPGDTVLRVSGPVTDLLKAERISLNLLQRLCGIATLTNQFVERVRGYPVRITDTRKTTPGLRQLEKYAVKKAGGYNHRFNLTDGVLIKDNHIAACGSISDAVGRVRGQIPHTIKIEVETDNIEQVRECVDCGVDIIMLDNMELQTMEKAVEIIDGKALVEASGGITLEVVEDIAKTGVDIISIGALTHSAKACDIGMDWCENQKI